jgi:hypothetical protein
LSGTRLELSPSWILAAAILMLHIAAAAALIAVLGNGLGVALGASFVALGMAAAWGRALLASGASVRALELSGNAMTVEMQDGRKVGAELDGQRHVSRFMVTLPVRRPMRRTILVTRDMLPAQEFRLLRLWALWGRLPGVAHKQLPA